MSPLDILEKCNYIVKYYYDTGKNEAKLQLNLKTQVDYVFEYKNGCLTSTYNKLNIRCPKICILPFIQFFVEEICKKNEYPVGRVKKYLNGNPCNQFKFLELTEEEETKQLYLSDMITKYQKYGLRPDLVSETYGLDLANELFPLISYDLGLTISPL